MSAIGATPAVLAFSLARSRWRMYSGARPRKSRTNTRTAQAMTALSMPTLGPGGDFNGAPSPMDPEPSRPLVPRGYTPWPPPNNSGLKPTGPNDCYLAESFRESERVLVQIPCPLRPGHLIGSNIWGRMRLKCLDVGDDLTRIWSGARDLNPGPHGPESRDSSSIHVGFLRFSVRFFKSTGPERPDLHESSAGLLHEVLQNAVRRDGFQRGQVLRSPVDRPALATPATATRIPICACRPLGTHTLTMSTSGRANNSSMSPMRSPHQRQTPSRGLARASRRQPPRGECWANRRLPLRGKAR